jgi:hypothetical protein
MPRLKQTHCIHGHPKTPENTYASGNCKPCTRLRIRNWRKNNYEQAINKCKKWKQENPEKAKRGPRKWYLENPERALLIGARCRANTRGIEFNLELNDIVIPEFCPVFPTLRLERGIGRGRGIPLDGCPTLDKIDNAKGYVKGNVWVISWRANFLKSNSTLEEMESLVKVWREKLHP